VTTRDSGSRPPERLQKILARAGFGSRRASEALIAAGRVRVNGEVAALGDRADPETDRIEVDGAVVGIRPGLVHYLLNKPAGVVTTASDPQDRPTVVGLVPAEPRVFPVGRLDADTEGLLLLTNDGELAHRLTHPSFGVDKEYLAGVDGRPTRGALRRLREGVELEDGPTAPAKVSLVGDRLLRIPCAAWCGCASARSPTGGWRRGSGGRWNPTRSAPSNGRRPCPAQGSVGDASRLDLTCLPPYEPCGAPPPSTSTTRTTCSSG
jgi:16S rRNA U516 pseudouridylate synthase RsuA-like enzyme